jgi:rubrerythrin
MSFVLNFFSDEARAARARRKAEIARANDVIRAENEARDEALSRWWREMLAKDDARRITEAEETKAEPEKDATIWNGIAEGKWPCPACGVLVTCRNRTNRIQHHRPGQDTSPDAIPQSEQCRGSWTPALSPDDRRKIEQQQKIAQRSSGLLHSDHRPERGDARCPRCNGRGYLREFWHIANGVCFRCGGSGSN